MGGNRGKITSAIFPVWPESETRHPQGSWRIPSHTSSSFFAPLREFPFSAMPIFQPAPFIFQPLQERLAV
ncbi:hypothetical protein Pla8534_68130 [Lignipirellula cremea]|uniref:Uncharacterized protein n=1 Tax=Lignipirellula cremea TaxID=2528010 RepID=A0A518E4A2_9BACT|nr:hypothetical protein Pla8534_68130 [Lignipirellula cremea]